jgi:glutaredoxin
MIDKLFTENIQIKPEGPLNTIDISSNYIIVLSMENCPYCEILQKDYISKTDEKYTVITYKSRHKTFSFDTNFIDIPTEERENIIDEVDKFLKGPCTFPTIIHNKKITRGLVDKSILNKIFNISSEN